MTLFGQNTTSLSLMTNGFTFTIYISVCKQTHINVIFTYKDSGSSRGVVANGLACDIVVSEFEFKSRYCVQFRTNTFGKVMNPLILQAVGLIVLLLFFYKDNFGVKYTVKVDMH